MSTHQRQQIRQAVTTALQTALGTVKVWPSRFLPFQVNQLPAVAVYTLSETVQPESINKTRGASRELWRDLTLVVEGIVRASAADGDNPDNDLDALALNIEVAMHADETFGGVCDKSMLQSTEISVLENGDKAFAVARLSYGFLYQTLAPDDANVNLPPLNTVQVTWELTDAPDNAQDKVTV